MTTVPGSLPSSSAMIERVGAWLVRAVVAIRAEPPSAAMAASASPTGPAAAMAGMVSPSGSMSVARGTAPLRRRAVAGDEARSAGGLCGQDLVAAVARPGADEDDGARRQVAVVGGFAAPARAIGGAGDPVDGHDRPADVTRRGEDEGRDVARPVGLAARFEDRAAVVREGGRRVGVLRHGPACLAKVGGGQVGRGVIAGRPDGAVARGRVADLGQGSQPCPQALLGDGRHDPSGVRRSRCRGGDGRRRGGSAGRRERGHEEDRRQGRERATHPCCHRRYGTAGTPRRPRPAACATVRRR